MLFVPLQAPISLATFWEILRYGLSAYTADLSWQPQRPGIQMYIAVNQVEGMPSGIYRWCSDCAGLHVIRRGDVRADMLSIHPTSSINCATANMIVYLVADYPALDAHFATRSYRIMNMEAGMVAHRLCTLSAAFDLAARCTDSYDIAKCQRILGIEGTSLLPAFQVIIGRELPGAGGRYRHDVWF
jgi:SagB-type dehydrogenase family enzyme